MQTSRRSFMKAALAAGAFPYLNGCATLFGPGKVRLACIGVGQQAWVDIQEFEKTGLAEIVALCDTDLEQGWQCEAALKRYPKAKRFTDFRKLFADEKTLRGIDAVAVMTPDFSHFPAVMAAMKCGKAVFVEKPLAHTFEECELLMAAEKKYGVVTQMGNQGHSGNNYYQFKEYVEQGVIDLTQLDRLVAHMNNPRRWHKWQGEVWAYPKAEKLPAGLDWDTWLGTAAAHDYSKDYVQGEWRSWYDFGNGCLGDWGAHTMDTMHRFFRLGLPTAVDIRDTRGWNPYVFPMQDTLTFKFAELKEGEKLVRPAVDLEWYEGVTNLPELPLGHVKTAFGSDIPPAPGSTAADVQSLNPGKFFYMKDGTAWQGGSHSAAIFRCGTDGKVPAYPQPGSNHYANFLKSVQELETTRSPFSVTGPLSQLFCLGCIAQRLNRSFKFDPVAKQVLGDEEANRLLKGSPNTPREGWKEFYEV